MAKYDFDLFVIGAGSGGVRAARIAAGHGARVGICEDSRVGGTCVIRGCVPKKLMVFAAEFGFGFDDARAYGWDVGRPQFDWPHFKSIRDAEIDRLNGIYIKLLANAGVELFEAHGRFVDEHTLQVGERQVTAQRILIATGGTPSWPHISGKEAGIVSDGVFDLPERPDRIVVMGGGYIALEFASIFAGLGSEVTIVHRGENLLRGFDHDVRRGVRVGMEGRGITMRLEETITKLDDGDDGIAVHLIGGDVLAADTVLFAVGRQPRIDGLNLDAIGIAQDCNGAIIVDEYSKTSIDSVFAVGDVTDRMALTPVALMEGHRFADTEFGGVQRAVDHGYVPSAVFSIPQAASVGLTEHEARAGEHEVEIYRSQFKPMLYALSGRDEQMMMKLIVDTNDRRVLGCHIVGDGAAEIMQTAAVALKMGATKDDFDATIGIHPSSAEELVTMRQPLAPPHVAKSEVPEDNSAIVNEA